MLWLFVQSSVISIAYKKLEMVLTTSTLLVLKISQWFQWALLHTDKKVLKKNFHATMPWLLPRIEICIFYKNLSIIYKKLDACVFHDFKRPRKFSAPWILTPNIVYKKLLFYNNLKFSPESITAIKYWESICMKNTGLNTE